VQSDFVSFIPLYRVCSISHPDFNFVSNSDALRLAPNSPDVLTMRGLVLFLSAKLPQALLHLQSALRLDPGHDHALQLRRRIKDIERLKEEGNQAFKAGLLQKAIDKYDATLEVCILYHWLHSHHIVFPANRQQGGGTQRRPNPCNIIVQPRHHVSQSKLTAFLQRFMHFTYCDSSTGMKMR
jgi:hypothetical protein